MELEMLLGALGVSFVGGMTYGHWADQKIGFMKDNWDILRDLKEETGSELEIKPYSNFLTSLRAKYGLSAVDGVIMSAVSTQNGNGFVESCFLNGLSFYIGTVAGKALSKVQRKKAKLSDEEKRRVDNYLLAVKGNFKQRPSVDEFLKVESISIQNMIIEKKNPELLRYFTNGLKNALDYGNFYRLVDSMFEFKEQFGDLAMDCSFMTKKGKDYNGVVAVVISGDKLAEVSYEEGKHVMHKLGFDDPSVKKMYADKEAVYVVSKSVEWDGSREKVTDVIMSNIENKDVVLASIPDTFPLQQSLVQVFQLYKTRPWEKKNGEAGK